jgi:hypothetical protein
MSVHEELRKILEAENLELKLQLQRNGPTAPQALNGLANEFVQPANLNLGAGVSLNSQTTYPFSLDNKKIVFGRHRGERYWDLTGKDAGYCSMLVSNAGGCNSEIEYRAYLLARGFP